MTINHNRLKPCKDMDLPAWLLRQRELRSNTPTYVPTPSTGNSKDLFCLCRGPDDGQLMIQCAECKEWYHGICVSITKDQANLIDVYLCPQCLPTSP